MTNELFIDDNDVLEIQDTDELLLQALHHGDTLATPQEGQMLIQITGVSIGAKPRKDGRYQGYVLRPDGKRYFYGQSREEVASKIKFFIKEEQSGRTIKKKERNSPLFGEYVEKWIELYKKPNLKPTSLDSLRTSLRPAIEAFGKRKMTSITSDNVQEMLLSIKAERMRDLCRVNLNQVFRKALVQKIIKLNPCDAVEMKRHKAQRKKALTREEQTIFMQAASETKYALLYRLLISTGLRIGEALALTRDDVDFTGHTVTVSKNVVFVRGEKIEQNTPKTAAGNRTVPISEELCEELAKIKTNALFPYTYNAVRLSMRRIAENTGIAVSPHILRHTYATRLEEAGVPPKVKQYLMGHASLEMTQNVYTDTQEAYVESVSERVRGLFDI